MAFDEALLEILRDATAHLSGIIEKPMVGGVGLMWHGNLLCGVMGVRLLVRVDKATAGSLVGEDGAQEMVMGRRSAKGWLLLPAAVAHSGPDLKKWLQRAGAYVATLPAKG